MYFTSSQYQYVILYDQILFPCRNKSLLSTHVATKNKVQLTTPELDKLEVS